MKIKVKQKHTTKVNDRTEEVVVVAAAVEELDGLTSWCGSLPLPVGCLMARLLDDVARR